MKKLLVILSTLVIIGLIPTAAFANGGTTDDVLYLDANGGEWPASNVTRLVPPENATIPGTLPQTTLTNGWYVVEGIRPVRLV